MERHKSLISLSSDHQQGLVISQKLKYGYKPSSSTDESISTEDKRKMLLDFFDDHLHSHFIMEEEIFIPYMPDNEMIKRMQDEHIKMYELLYIIEVMDPDEELLNRFGEKLNAHIRFEERELFPMLQENLTEEQLIEIGKKLESS
jgi:hemerythrin-like domain-containing protein